jgi:hypothetical protein
MKLPFDPSIRISLHTSLTRDADHFSATMRRMPVVQVRSRVERWQRPRCRGRGEQNSGSQAPQCRIRAAGVETHVANPRFRALPKPPFFDAGRVMYWSGYHLALALIGRGVGRMTPRS